jgi:L1 cell adhesion molecule like protein
MTKDNHKLGNFDLTGIPPAPRGVPQVEVTFDIDSNGILNVSAVEKGSGKTNKITITNDSSRLTKEDIQRMTEDAEKYKQEDDELRERLEMRNSLENMIYTTKNSYNDKIKQEDTSETEKEQYTKNVDMLNTFAEWLENNQEASKEDLKMKIDQVQVLAKDLYSKTPSEPPVSDDLD